VRLALAGGVRGEISLAGHRRPFAGAAGPGITCLDLPPFEVPDGIDHLALTIRVEAADRLGSASAGASQLLALDALRVDPREND
jgi:hypothetical protein